MEIICIYMKSLLLFRQNMVRKLFIVQVTYKQKRNKNNETFIHTYSIAFRVYKSCCCTRE